MTRATELDAPPPSDPRVCCYHLGIHPIVSEIDYVYSISPSKAARPVSSLFFTLTRSPSCQQPRPAAGRRVCDAAAAAGQWGRSTSSMTAEAAAPALRSIPNSIHRSIGLSLLAAGLPISDCVKQLLIKLIEPPTTHTHTNPHTAASSPTRRRRPWRGVLAARTVSCAVAAPAGGDRLG